MDTCIMEQRLQAFIAANTGKPGVGNTPQNIGQCVGLSEVWMQLLGLPHVWGNAKDLLVDADKTAYDVVYNSPTNAPSAGDILVWDGSWGNGLGHTGIVLEADVNTVKVFEQNNPVGSPPHVLLHNYVGVLGWLHPKTLPTTVTQSVTDSQIQDQLNAQIQATNSCQTQLKTATEQNALLQEQFTQLQKNLNDVKLKYDESERTVIDLKGQLETLNKEDKDYAQKAYDAEHLAEDRGNRLHAIADGLDVPYDAGKEDDVTEQILGEMHKMKQLQPPPPSDAVKLEDVAVKLAVNSLPQKSFLGRLAGLFFVSA